jgi:cyclohexadieny/prephenate dehydrogenase
MTTVFERIAVVGVGLIGASLARGAREYGAAREISLYDADAGVRARARALALGEVFDQIGAAVADADLVILAVPVGAMGQAMAAAAPSLKAGVIVSDVGSVKQSVVAEVAPLLPPGAVLVPAHPLAGTEHSGPDAGFSHLFQNRWLIMTPLAQSEADRAAAARLAAFWARLGARIETMTPERHDAVLAVVSHLPHLIAFNIVAMAEDLENVTESEVVKYSASGFRDFTRIAASDPTMWRDVFLANRDAVLEALGRFSEDLSALQRAIRWGEGDKLYDLFDRARRMRREVIDAGQDTAAPNFGRDQER